MREKGELKKHRGLGGGGGTLVGFSIYGMCPPAHGNKQDLTNNFVGQTRQFHHINSGPSTHVRTFGGDFELKILRMRRFSLDNGPEISGKPHPMQLMMTPLLGGSPRCAMDKEVFAQQAYIQCSGT